jgi:hypothetical protein
MRKVLNKLECRYQGIFTYPIESRAGFISGFIKKTNSGLINEAIAILSGIAPGTLGDESRHFLSIDKSLH